MSLNLRFSIPAVSSFDKFEERTWSCVYMYIIWSLLHSDKFNKKRSVCTTLDIYAFIKSRNWRETHKNIETLFFCNNEISIDEKSMIFNNVPA